MPDTAGVALGDLVKQPNDFDDKQAALRIAISRTRMPLFIQLIPEKTQTDLIIPIQSI